MNLQQLRVFCRVVEEGGFRAAAERLYLSQPAVSQQIAALEKSYSVRLFERRGRSLSLSPEGRALFVLAREVLEKADAIPRRFREMRSLRQGSLSFGVAAFSAASLLPPALRRFREECPDIRLSLVSDRFDRLLGRLRAGEVELVLAGQDPSCPPDPELVARPLGTDRLVLAVPPGHPWGRGEALSPSRLEEETLIRFLPECPLHSPVEDFLLQHRVRIRSDLRVNGIEVAARLVEEGLGVALLNRGGLAPAPTPDSLQIAPLPELEGIHWELLLVYSARLGLSYAGWAMERIVEEVAAPILRSPAPC
jgi:DNA-binding transcriptional LysR family regulator